jgi:hypothetical protein
VKGGAACAALTLPDGEIQFASLSVDPHNLFDIPSLSPTSVWILRCIGGLVVATSLGLCVSSDVDRELYARWPARLNQQYAHWDALIRSGAAPGRGVFLKFVHFPKNAGGITANVYFRAVYAMYPRPVLVAQPEVVVNSTMQLLAGNSAADDRSLRDRGVGSIVVLDLVGTQPAIARVNWLAQ